MIGSSSKTGGITIPTMTPKAFEAELIQKATQTAIIAARSILVSGGTEESALKTAKAAAESVLNPAGSESGTVSASSSLGNAFGGKKRRAKRQAEVVASMALMSATSLKPSGSNLMGESDSVNTKMYGRNIVTVNQDEPSVLSGSTRPPKTPKTPGSTRSRLSFQQTLPQVKEATEGRDPAPEQNTYNFAHTHMPPASPQNAVMSPQNAALSPNDASASGYNSFLSECDDTESDPFGINDSTTVDSERESFEESTLYDETDDDTEALFFETKKEKRSSRSESRDTSPWNLDTLFNQLQKLDLNKLDLSKLDLSKLDLNKLNFNLDQFNLDQFNLDQFNLKQFNLDMMKCGEGVFPFEEPRLSSRGRDRRRSGRRSERSRARETTVYDSRDDTFEDDTTAFSPPSTPKEDTFEDETTAFSPPSTPKEDTFEDETTAFSPPSTPKKKEKEMYKDSDFPNSYSSESCHSDILSTDFSEEEIKVRSSIRETMETMAHKSALVRNKMSSIKSLNMSSGNQASATQPKRSRSFFRKMR